MVRLSTEEVVAIARQVVFPRVFADVDELVIPVHRVREVVREFLGRDYVDERVVLYRRLYAALGVVLFAMGYKLAAVETEKSSSAPAKYVALYFSRCRSESICCEDYVCYAMKLCEFIVEHMASPSKLSINIKHPEEGIRFTLQDFAEWMRQKCGNKTLSITSPQLAELARIIGEVLGYDIEIRPCKGTRSNMWIVVKKRSKEKHVLDRDEIEPD